MCVRVNYRGWQTDPIAAKRAYYGSLTIKHIYVILKLKLFCLKGHVTRYAHRYTTVHLQCTTDLETMDVMKAAFLSSLLFTPV